MGICCKQSYIHTTNLDDKAVLRAENIASDVNLLNSVEHRRIRDRMVNMFNIGILEENLSSIPGVVNILEKIQEYVPADGANVHTLICWRDGLSYERHVDAQSSRANADNSLLRLEGLEPSAQVFHKRMLLMQNVFNQRSVTRNVSESFNYVSEFLRFVTEGYITAFALEELQLDDLNEEVEINTEDVQRVSEVIVDNIWNPTRIVDG
ncbi:hypothetical protein MAR_015115 [Mya arenaria]|uniref:DUF6589 domain-containing protein n=1 Tax=Mya arenaria TaxID=6604 RepID=A0ABY7FK84_MYAAR|nr:hypothetical protein MAR_015115 [Mya arenaria]